MKISVLNWLVWDDKVLTLNNLVARGCNKLPIATCILCHSVIETIDHLFIHCAGETNIWNHFARVLGINRTPYSMANLWDGWLKGLRHANRLPYSLLAKAII